MADLPALQMIAINPNLSGRALKVLTLVRDDDGTFAPQDENAVVNLGDGQTTIINIPVGGRLVISEEHEPALRKAMAAHPAVTGHAPKPLDAKEEDRRQTLASRRTLSKEDKSDLAALQARVPAHASAPAKK